MDEGLVTIVRLNDTQKASFIQAMLEEQGIESFLQGQNMRNLGYAGNFYIGGLELQVRTSQAEDATRFLTEHHYLQPEKQSRLLLKIHNYFAEHEDLVDKFSRAYTFLKYLFLAGFILGIIIVLFKWLVLSE